jgi:hypothetical protein
MRPRPVKTSSKMMGRPDHGSVSKEEELGDSEVDAEISCVLERMVLIRTCWNNGSLQQAC